MEKFKGTPGPWVFSQKVERLYDYDMGGFVGQEGQVVCWFGDAENYYPTEGKAPSDEDIRLIEAAPDLLDALQNIVSDYDRYKSSILAGNTEKEPEPVKYARTAIKKALGNDGGEE